MTVNHATEYMLHVNNNGSFWNCQRWWILFWAWAFCPWYGMWDQTAMPVGSLSWFLSPWIIYDISVINCTLVLFCKTRGHILNTLIHATFENLWPISPINCILVLQQAHMPLSELFNPCHLHTRWFWLVHSLAVITAISYENCFWLVKKTNNFAKSPVIGQLNIGGNFGLKLKVPVTQWPASRGNRPISKDLQY